jgi:hypothetical protein
MPITKSLNEKLKEYSTGLGSMEDDALLDEVHRARGAHKAAPNADKDEAYLKAMAADAEMTRRFGVGAAEKKYRARHP